MNKILYAILGLTTLVNGIRISHIIEDEAAAMAAAEADANADAMAGADANAGAGADAGAGDEADEDDDHHDDCGCGCDGCCGGNDVNIDIQFVVNVAGPAAEEPATEDPAAGEPAAEETTVTEETTTTMEEGASSTTTTTTTTTTTEEMTTEEEEEEVEIIPDVANVISEDRFIWDNTTCMMETTFFMRVDGSIVQGETTSSPATAQDCCDAGIGLEATVDPCTV